MRAVLLSDFQTRFTHPTKLQSGGNAVGQEDWKWEKGAVIKRRLRIRLGAKSQCCQMAKFDPFLSLHCARVEAWGRNPRKGRDQILQRSVAEP